MSRRSKTAGWPYDLLVTVAIATAAFVLVHLPLPFEPILRPLLVLPLVAFLSGYAVVAALFPRRPEFDDSPATRVEIDWYERCVLSATVSLTIAVLTGIVLDATIWSIVLSNVVNVIAGVTIVGAIGGVIRRSRLAPDERFSFERDVLAGVSGPRTVRPRRLATPANMAVLLALLITFGSVVAVTAMPRDGETDTDVGILTLNGDDELQAEDYPQQIPKDEQRQLVLSIQNREHETVNYTAIVKLERVSETGEVLEAAELTRFRQSMNHSETEHVEHAVEPTFSGERLRLTYLVYRGTPPADPTVDNAYREVHLWISVPESEATERVS